MTVSQFAARVRGRYQRTTARYLFRRPFTIDSQIPLISFTFDDFPRSALLTGGAILKRYGLAGTYYASFGLMGTEAPTGQIFLREDIDALLAGDHELGCHTFAHCHSWHTMPGAFEDAIIENGQALDGLFPGASFRTFSYPISVPRPKTKRAAARHFVCCRGGGQTFNVGTTDLSHLSAYFLEKDRHKPEAPKEVIEQNRRARGWLIFATHDISNTPTPYGCTPEFFEKIVDCAVRSGARILPVIQVFEALRGSTSVDKPLNE
jgi:peptidoglycan/xylan/chitin deacetylase (PgdA/CDA1 family)